MEKRGRPEEQELGREQLGEQGPGRVRPAEDKEVMELAIGAGHLLLENGAEIFRVEETMDRICRHYGVESAMESLPQRAMRGRDFLPRSSTFPSAALIWTRWRR